MKICAAQIRTIKGDIQTNIEKHKKLIELAVSYTADVIIFPELSITGYEPALAKELAVEQDDNSLLVFQEISDANKIIIGVGMPVKNDAGICISMIIFHPGRARQVYSKKYLHTDEEPFFVSGINRTVLINQTNIGLAICYELFVPEHAAHACSQDAKIYLASVAKSASGIKKAAITLPAIAKKYSMPVLMANCVGYCDNFESAGSSTIWNSNGLLLEQLNDRDEGIVIMNAETQEIITALI